MTVQSIDKRTAADSSTTSTAQDRQNSAPSADDAFVALLRQASQRFGSQSSTTAMSANSVLADHFNAARADAKDDAQRSARDADSADRTSARNDKSAAKADRSRQDPGNTASTRSAVKSSRSDDDASAAAPASTAATDTSAPADKTDRSPAKADAGSDKKKNDDQAPGPVADAAPTPEAPAAVVEPVAAPVQVQVAVAKDDTAADTQAKTAQAGQARPDQVAQAAGPATAPRSQQQSAGAAQDQAANAAAADADAASLAADLAAQAGSSQSTAAADSAKAARTDAARDQAGDLASRLADTGASIQVKVQTASASDQAAAATPASSAANAAAAVDLAAQGQAGQGSGQSGAGHNGQDPNPRFGAQAQQDNAAVSLAPAPPAEGEAVPAQTAKQPGDAFAAILAAQSEASGAGEAAAPEARPVANLTGLAGTQAADKAAAQTAPAQAVRVPRVPMPTHVLDQINVQISKAVKEGSDTVKIQLRPLDLGRIEIKLDVGTDGKVTATVTADKPETLAMLQKDSRGLEKALEDAGLKPDSSTTSFNLRGGEQQQQQQAADRNADQGRSGRSRGQGRDFGADADLLATAPIQTGASRISNGRSGVDISV